MARNEEKAQGMFNRWTRMKMGGFDAPTKRPYLASDCTSIPECDKWRRQILREVTSKVTQIQNAGLGEHKIRDLNDQINKLMREKWAWEKQMFSLGGPNHMGSQALEFGGKELPGGNGYKYFGAAKDLPGVRELFQEAEENQPEPPRRPRYEIYKNIDPDYYGWRDEDDGILLPLEAEAEAKSIEAAVQRWKADRIKRKREKQQMKAAAAEQADQKAQAASELAAKRQHMAGAAASVPSLADEAAGLSDSDSSDDDTAADAEFKAHVSVPSQADIQQLLIAKKKEALLAKYASAELRSEEAEAKKMLNLQK